MPSKRVDFFAFIAEGYDIQIKKANAGRKDNPDVNVTIQSKHPIQIAKESHEIESSILTGRYEGLFQFIAKKQGRQLYERSIRVNSLTGNIDDTDISNLSIPSRVEADYSLSFGLYNSDAAIISDLPNGHQLYATLTPNMTRWQQELFSQYKAKHGQLNSLRFSKLFLPGSHDAGMYTDMPSPISDLANTQKDDTSTQLALGARYFDFRPGIIQPNFYEVLMALFEKQDSFWNYYKNILNAYKSLLLAYGSIAIAPFIGQLRHIHTFIPGETFKNFIAAILDFLSKHEQEIVVVQIANSGFISPAAVETPTKERLLGEISSLFQNSTIKIGDKTRLNDNVQNILDSHERLIILFREDQLDVLDTYEDDKDKPDYNYKTYDPQILINNFNRINFDAAKNKDYIKFQHQLTASSVNGAIAKIVAAIPASPIISNKDIFTSPLYATKPAADQRTYDWLLSKLNYATREQLMVGINDFYDNMFSYVAKTISQMRLELFNLFPANNNVLTKAARLNKGQSIVSKNRHYQLIFQDDGNLVMYNLLNKPLWASNTNGKGGTYAVMQEDGNLVILNGNNPIWSIHAQVKNYTFSHNAKLVIEDDGNLLIYSEDEKTTIWAKP